VLVGGDRSGAEQNGQHGGDGDPRTGQAYRTCRCAHPPSDLTSTFIRFSSRIAISETDFVGRWRLNIDIDSVWLHRVKGPM
jgi:hypothetical protein